MSQFKFGPRLAACALGASLALACAKPGDPSKDEEKKSGDSTPKAPQSSGDASPVLKTGPLLTVVFANPEKLSKLRVSSVGSEDKLSLQAAGDGSYQVTGLKDGRWDLIIEAESQQGSQSKEVGIKISSLLLETDAPLRLPKVLLLPKLDIKGNVILESPSSASVSVTIPGTPYQTSVSPDGSFTLSGVPSGGHEIVFSSQGFAQGLLANRYYRDSTTLKPMYLFKQTQDLSPGIYYFGAALAKGASAKIPLALHAPAGADTMRISLSQAEIDQAEWIPFSSSFEAQLGPEERTVYVQFAIERKQLSAIFNLKVPNAP